MAPPNSKETDSNRPKAGTQPGRSGSDGLSPRPSSRRLWLMRLMAAVVIPALLLGSLELGLRVVGFGHSTHFFEPVEVEGEDFLFTNHKYTHRFFPPALARSPVPLRIRADKPADTYRIFVFGESAANGDPESAYSVGRHLEILLQERFPGTDFEVVCTAITAINSHGILPIARECAGLDGDLWIVYMGNNEMVGTYGAGTVFGAKAPPLLAVRTILAIKSTRIGQLLNSLLQSLKRDSSAPESWGGINMFTDNLLRPDDPGRLRVYENFRGNLEDILQAGQRAGVPVMLSTMASNLRDCAPFASQHALDLTQEQLARWDSFFARGKALEAAKSYQEALNQYAQAAAIDPDFAELHFRMGRCHGLSGNLIEAKQALEKARDADGLVVRSDTRLNRIIRETADKAVDGTVVLVDSAELLAKDSPGGIPGQELFYEHVHFTLQGNYQLARILAEKAVATLPDRITASDKKSWVSRGTCQRQLAVTLFDKNRLWTDMHERLSTPPYTQRSTNPANLGYCEKMAQAVRARMNSRMDRQIYELALAANPDDYHLHARFGYFLENTGAIPEAIRELQWVCDVFPEFEGGHQELGIALLLAKRYREAEASFERVLEIRPGYAKAQKALELIRKDPRYEAGSGKD